MKRAYYKIPYQRKCFLQRDGFYPPFYYATKTRPPTNQQLGEDETTCVNIDAYDDLQNIIKEYKGKYTNEEAKQVPIGVPDYTFPTAISIDTSNIDVERFDENEGLYDFPSCSSTSRKSTLNLEAQRIQKMKRIDYSKINSDIIWNNQSDDINEEIMNDMFQDQYPQTFDQTSFDEFMIDGMMSKEMFQHLASYARFQRSHYIKVYCKTLKEYMKEVHGYCHPHKKTQI